MRKKILKVALIVIVAFLVCEGFIVAISSYIGARNKEWGLNLSVEDVTSKGLKLTAQRNNSKISDEVIVEENYWIQRWTVFGWKYIDSESLYSMPTLKEESVMKEGDSWTRELQWENRYGKLGPGIYRIVDGVTSYRGEKADKDFKLYATFCVFF